MTTWGQEPVKESILEAIEAHPCPLLGEESGLQLSEVIPHSTTLPLEEFFLAPIYAGAVAAMALRFRCMLNHRVRL
jgi:hypothetical protein